MLQQSNFHRGTLTQADLVAADTAVSATTYTELGRYTIPAGVGMAIGFSNMEGQNSAPGRAFADPQDAAGVAINGTFRVEIHDPEDHPLRTAFEGHTSRLRTSATNPAQQVPLPVTPPGYGKDYNVVLLFKADVAGKTVAAAKTTCTFDVTRYTVRDV